jgi:hypothetical protein
LKIAILIPCHGQPETMFMQSLMNMISHTYEARLTDADGEPIEVQIETFIVGSSILTEGRHELVSLALIWGADYLLWCDADHVFPKDAFCRLWAHNLDIVGANYARRGKPTAPTAAKIRGALDRDNFVYTTEAKAAAGELEEVDHLGFGFCLMKAGVFDGLQLHAEACGEESMMPLFEMKRNPNGTGIIGEDVFFFRKCRDAGFPVWCDHGLSWEVGHIFKNILTNAHTITQIDAWERSRKDVGKRFKRAIEEREAAE